MEPLFFLDKVFMRVDGIRCVENIPSCGEKVSVDKQRIGYTLFCGSNTNGSGCDSGYVEGGYVASGYFEGDNAVQAEAAYVESGYVEHGYVESDSSEERYVASGYVAYGYLDDSTTPSLYVEAGYVASGYMEGDCSSTRQEIFAIEVDTKDIVYAKTISGYVPKYCGERLPESPTAALGLLKSKVRFKTL